MKFAIFKQNINDGYLLLVIQVLNEFGTRILHDGQVCKKKKINKNEYYNFNNNNYTL